jgi:multidrug resistance efflux pump
MSGPDDTSERDEQAAGGVLAPERPEATPAEPPKRKMKRGLRIAMFVIILVTVLEAAAFGGTWFFYTRHYVSTDNAEVDGDKIDINAPASGTLVNWTIDQGSQVHENEVVGRVKLQGSGVQPQKVIRAPGVGTVAVNNAVNGQYVTQGSELATAYDFNKVYVTARVEENDIAAVKVGQLVNIAVDAFPNAHVTGIVQEIQNSAASQFTIYPGPSTDPTNPQKVDQYVPVKIQLLDTDGQNVVPGMSVTVHISRD